jgi:hypothetical protein
MRYLILLFSLFFCKSVCSQHLNYRDSVELLIKAARKGNKIDKEKDSNGGRLAYFYNKKSKELVSIVLVTEDKESFYYYYSESMLLCFSIIPSYKKYPERIGERMKGIYYLRNGEVVDKVEYNFPSLDIESFKKLGEELFLRGSAFLKTKGIQ